MINVEQWVKSRVAVVAEVLNFPELKLVGVDHMTPRAETWDVTTPDEVEYDIIKSGNKNSSVLPKDASIQSFVVNTQNFKFRIAKWRNLFILINPYIDEKARGNLFLGVPGGAAIYSASFPELRIDKSAMSIYLQGIDLNPSIFAVDQGGGVSLQAVRTAVAITVGEQCIKDETIKIDIIA